MKMSNLSRKTTAVDVEIGQRLRDMRQLAGMSQSEVGAMIGVSFQQIQKYEAGKNRISVAAMIFIADRFKVSPASILKGITT
jgi:transcriptional regulator with XRE-family HTH domain